MNQSNGLNSKAEVSGKSSGNSKTKSKGRKKVKLAVKIKNVCELCKSSVPKKEDLLVCKECGISFCENCEGQIRKEETFFDGIETRLLSSDYPLCENCYKTNIQKQKDLFTMHRRFLQLRETLPAESDIWFSTGERFIDSRLFDLARLCFNEAINIDEKVFDSIVNSWDSTGQKFLGESRDTEALLCFDEALTLEPMSENTWQNKGKTLEKLHRLEEAVEAYNKVIEINKKNIESLCRKGLLLSKLNEPNASRKCFIKAINIDPGNEMIWLYKLRSHLQFNEDRELIECTNRALKINPNNEETWLAKWKGLMNLKEHSEAMACCDEIIRLNPINPNGWQCKGDTLLKLGKYEEAVLTLNKAMNLDPTGKQIDVRELQKTIRKAEHSSLGFVPIPEWMSIGGQITYNFSDYNRQEHPDILEIDIYRDTPNSVTITEKLPLGEPNEIEIEVDENNKVKADMIRKYWAGLEFNEGDKIKDIDDRQYTVKGLDQIGTSFGPIKCWRLEYFEEKGKNKTKIKSWFDANSGLLIKKVFNHRESSNPPEHWEIKLNDSNISELPLESATEIEPEPVPEGPISEEILKEPLLGEESELILEDEKKVLVEKDMEKLLVEMEDESKLVEEQKRKLGKFRKRLRNEESKLNDERSKFEEERRKFKIEKQKFEKEKNKFIEERNQTAKDEEKKRRIYKKEKQKFKEELSKFEAEKEKLARKRQQLEESYHHRLDEEKKRQAEDEDRRKELKLEEKNFEKARSKFEEEKNTFKEEILKYKQVRKQKVEVDKQLKVEGEEKRKKVEIELEDLETKIKNFEEEKKKFEEEHESRAKEEEQFKKELKKKQKQAEADLQKLEDERNKLRKEQEKLEKDRKLQVDKEEKLKHTQEKFKQEMESVPEKVQFEVEESEIGTDQIEKDTQEPLDVEAGGGVKKKKKKKKKKKRKKEGEEVETVEESVEVEEGKEVEISVEAGVEPEMPVEPEGERHPTDEELNDLYEELSQKGLSDEKLGDKKTTIKNHLATVKNNLIEMKKNGIDISEFKELHIQANSKLKEEKCLESLKLIIKIVKDTDNLEKTSLETQINELMARIDESSKLYPTASAKGGLSKAQKEMANNNFKEARSLVLESQKLLDESEKHNQKAKELIEMVEQKIKNEKKAGFNVQKPEEILTKMKQSFEANRYLELTELKNQCLIAMDKSRNEYREVLDKMKEAQDEHARLAKEGVNLDANKKFLKEAKKLLVSGDYSQALELTRKSIDAGKISWGASYLLVDAKPVLAFTVQRMLSEQNVSSLTFSSLPPVELSEKYKFESDESLWLTDEDEKDAVSPRDLRIVVEKITQFIKETEMSVILIDGIDKILEKNSIDVLLDFMKELNNTISNEKSIIILISTPQALSKEDMKTMEDVVNNLTNVDFKSISDLI